MLTPAMREIIPLFRFEVKHLKTSHHSYILCCFHKLAATPSCPSPRCVWSQARHNIVSYLTEAPEERGLFSFCLTLTDPQTQLFISVLYCYRRQKNYFRSMLGFANLYFVITEYICSSSESHVYTLRQSTSSAHHLICTSGAGNSCQALSFCFLFPPQHPVICFAWNSLVLNSAVVLIEL